MCRRRWYSGEHSCLPSSWPGFDSRPTQCPFSFSKLFLYLLKEKNVCMSKGKVKWAYNTGTWTRFGMPIFTFCKIQSKTLWRRELDGLYRLVLREQLLACSEYFCKHCTYVEIVYQASGSILPTSDSYCFLFLIKPFLIPPAKSLCLFSINFTTFPGVC